MCLTMASFIFHSQYGGNGGLNKTYLAAPEGLSWFFSFVYVQRQMILLVRPERFLNVFAAM